MSPALFPKSVTLALLSKNPPKVQSPCYWKVAAFSGFSWVFSWKAVEGKGKPSTRARGSLSLEVPSMFLEKPFPYHSPGFLFGPNRVSRPLSCIPTTSLLQGECWAARLLPSFFPTPRCSHLALHSPKSAGQGCPNPLPTSVTCCSHHMSFALMGLPTHSAFCDVDPDLDKQ